MLKSLPISPITYLEKLICKLIISFLWIILYYIRFLKIYSIIIHTWTLFRDIFRICLHLILCSCIPLKY